MAKAKKVELSDFDDTVFEETPGDGIKVEGTEVVQEISVHYEEWRVEIKKPGEYEKIKMVRPCVKIEDHQAEALNEGVVWGGNTYALMYFKQTTK